MRLQNIRKLLNKLCTFCFNKSFPPPKDVSFLKLPLHQLDEFVILDGAVPVAIGLIDEGGDLGLGYSCSELVEHVADVLTAQFAGARAVVDAEGLGVLLLLVPEACPCADVVDEGLQGDASAINRDGVDHLLQFGVGGVQVVLAEDASQLTLV